MLSQKTVYQTNFRQHVSSGEAPIMNDRVATEHVSGFPYVRGVQVLLWEDSDRTSTEPLMTNSTQPFFRYDNLAIPSTFGSRQSIAQAQHGF